MPTALKAAMKTVDADTIRKLRSAEPFKPFRLVMRDGRKLPVEHPWFVLVSRGGGTVIHSSVRGGFEFLSTAEIVDVLLGIPRRTRRR